MPDYIEREVAKNAVRDALDVYISNELIAYSIDKAPSADVVPAVYGKWEPGNPIRPVCGQNKFKGLDADIWADWQPPFCPICGTKMSGEDNAID